MSIKTKPHERLSRPLEAALYNIVSAHRFFDEDEEQQGQKCVRRARTLMRQLEKRENDEYFLMDAVKNLLQYVEDSWGLWANREEEGPDAGTSRPEIVAERG